jgi:uncharacterized membrane protein
MAASTWCASQGKTGSCATFFLIRGVFDYLPAAGLGALGAYPVLDSSGNGVLLKLCLEGGAMITGAAEGFSGLDQAMKTIAVGLEVVGVAVIVLGALVTSGLFFKRLAKEQSLEERVHQFRNDLGMAILLGLEFLIASDIVGTVAAGATFQDLGILGLLVLIRTFLSFALQLEITGRLPWQKAGEGRSGK